MASFGQRTLSSGIEHDREHPASRGTSLKTRGQAFQHLPKPGCGRIVHVKTKSKQLTLGKDKLEAVIAAREFEAEWIATMATPCTVESLTR